MILLNYIICFLIGLILTKLYKDSEINDYKNTINLLEIEKEQLTKEKETMQKILNNLTKEDIELIHRKNYTLFIANNKEDYEF